MNSALQAAASYAVEYLDGLGERPVNATSEDASLRKRLDRRLAEDGMPAEQAIETLVRGVEGGLLGMPSGRFFGWVIGGALPSALAADWLTSAWNQNAVLYECSPAASIVEEVVGRWLKEIFGLPRTTGFALVTGCQMAHVTCLAAARNALLRERDSNVEARGLWQAPQVRVISTPDFHASIEKALRLLGLGTDRMTVLSGSGAESQTQELEGMLRTHAADPAILLLRAGDINEGGLDSFTSLIPLAKRYNAWVHVDGAFGLWAAASPKYRQLTNGIEAADSWATDGHKWLNVPFDCGYAFVRSSDAQRSAMSVSAPYIANNADLRDPIDWTPEWSRRARGFATYAALLELGRRGVRELIERTCDHAAGIIDGLAQLPTVEVLRRPIINQGLVRFRDPRTGAVAQDHDRRTEDIIRTIVAGGEAFFAPTTWHGKRAMRVSVVNWRTTEVDVRRAVTAVARAISTEALIS